MTKHVHLLNQFATKVNETGNGLSNYLNISNSPSFTNEEILQQKVYNPTKTEGTITTEPKRMHLFDVNLSNRCTSNAIVCMDWVKSDHGCTARVYFDNAGDNMTLTLYNVTLTSRKPCFHNNKCDCSETNGIKEVYVFSIKYR